MTDTSKLDGIRDILEKVALSHGCLDDDGNDWQEQRAAIESAEDTIRGYIEIEKEQSRVEGWNASQNSLRTEKDS